MRNENLNNTASPMRWLISILLRLIISKNCVVVENNNYSASTSIKYRLNFVILCKFFYPIMMKNMFCDIYNKKSCFYYFLKVLIN